MRDRAYGFIRRQPWLYDIDHDSMHWRYRRIAHVGLRAAARLENLREKWFRPSWRSESEPIRLNLGSGRQPLNGWINVDLNPLSRPDLWIDLRDTWPFQENEVEAVYIRHCLEHFAEPDVLKILRQCYRVLGQGKGMRVGVPALEFAIEQYKSGGVGFASWVTAPAQSPGRRFFTYMMDNGNHMIMFDYSYMDELLRLTGFRDVGRVSGGESRFLPPVLLSPKDTQGDVATLYVECLK